MCPTIENIGTSDPNNPTRKMSDCPHQHLKDLGLEDLRAIVREETGSGRKIVRFLTRAMDGVIPGFQPHHELEAAKILANLDSEEAAEYVRSYGSRGRRRVSNGGGRSSNGAVKASDLGQSDPYLVIEPGISDIARFIREETSSGRTIVRRLIQIMDTCEDPYKPHHNLAAAKELLSRGWAMPNAVECAWYCGHHLSASYFNGHKSQNTQNGSTQSSEDSSPAATTVKANTATTAVEASTESAVEAAPATTTAEDSSPATTTVKANNATTAVEDSPEKSTKTGFTDLDVLPEHYWTSVLELCERLEEKGTIPQLPIAPDDPIPNVCSIKIANFPEVDLTDDEVAERFWERVAEQIEIQEDWNEMWHYRPYRGLRAADPDLWEEVYGDLYRKFLQRPDP